MGSTEYKFSRVIATVDGYSIPVVSYGSLPEDALGPGDLWWLKCVTDIREIGSVNWSVGWGDGPVTELRNRRISLLVDKRNGGVFLYMTLEAEQRILRHLRDRIVAMRKRMKDEKNKRKSNS